VKFVAPVLAGVALFCAPSAAFAQLAAHPRVGGTELSNVELAAQGGSLEKAHRDWRQVAWNDLAKAALAPGAYVIRFQVAGGEHLALEIPVCAGRGRVLVDGVAVPTAAGPLVLPLPPRPAEAHQVEIEITVGSYEHRVACGGAPRFGAQVDTREGLGVITFLSAYGALGGGKAVVFVPPGHDGSKPGALLVGLHPWNGGTWTYAAYAELLREATARDVILLMPSGLGNSLYTASAEDEVLHAIEAVSQALPVDPRRVSLWGASMGGAGATTIGFHHPDKFATVTSFFGDSKYDLATYVKAILPNEASAHAVNALDVVENARNLGVWLVHGEDDHVSPIAQSSMLARALTERGFAVRFDRVPHAGHEGSLAARFLIALVDKASEAHVPSLPSRVSFRSVRPGDTTAYGVRIFRTGGDAFVDLERRADGIHVLKATNVKTIELTRGSLGATEGTPVVIDDPAIKVEVRWEPSVSVVLPR
jgi:pimeloyl-ACP methyl ester carboxylesterase